MSKAANASSKAKRLAKLKPRKFFYRREEAAFSLGLSVSSIDIMISDQRLTTRRVGRCVLIPEADVEKVADTIMRHDMLQGVSPSGTGLR